MAQTSVALTKLPNDTLVKMAASKIDEPSFDVRQFDQISVLVD